MTIVLAIAGATGAALIVSGDKDMLDLEIFQNTTQAYMKLKLVQKVAEW